MLHRLIHYHPDGDGGSGEGGSGEGSPGGNGTTQTPPEGNGGSGSGSGNGNQNQDMIPRAEAEEARREAKNLRDRLKAAEKERDDLKTSQMSDAEKVQKERDDALAAASDLDKRVRTLQVQVLAGKVGIVDPEAASALLDWTTIKDVDDSAEVEKALRALVKAKPYLAGTVAGGGDGGAGNGAGAGGTGSMNDLIRSGFGVRSGAGS